MFEQLKKSLSDYWAGVQQRWQEELTIKADRPCPKPGLSGLQLPVGCYVEDREERNEKQ